MSWPQTITKCKRTIWRTDRGVASVRSPGVRPATEEEVWYLVVSEWLKVTTITSPQVYCERPVAFHTESGCWTDFRAPTKSVERSTAFWLTSSTRKSGRFIRTTDNAWLKELQSHRKRTPANFFSKFLLWNRKKQVTVWRASDCCGSGVAKCDSMMSSWIVDALLTSQKVIFLKNYWVFLQATFYDFNCKSPENSFKVVWGRHGNFIFWPILAQGATSSQWLPSDSRWWCQ